MSQTHPHLVAELHPTLNPDFDPTTRVATGRGEPWWVCPEGHAYRMRLRRRATTSAGCTECRTLAVAAKRIASNHPVLVERWHPTKNTTTPEQHILGTTGPLWLVQPCGHERELTVGSQRSGTIETLLDQCAACAGKVLIPGVNDLASQYPRRAAEWHPTLNGDLRPDQVFVRTSKPYWFLCRCGAPNRRSITGITGRGVDAETRCTCTPRTRAAAQRALAAIEGAAE